MNDDKLTWKRLSSKPIYETRIFSVQEVNKIFSNGDKANFVQIEAPDWVTIIPELPGTGENREFLTVRQYRHGSGKVGMEFPAGTVDPGEQPARTAARELLEETGYTAAELIKIGSVNPNPAFMTNTTYTFLARGLQKVADQNLDEHEYLDVHTETYKNLMRIIGTEEYHSAITVQAWHFYLRYTGDIG
ncbi:MAG: hypothetical protein B0D92_00115 [Spirochaeta sp. LUC14_002_19_P3]|nr:MAG: hypothetical protein B0D92_00115 [Spirochaeta sp. LUC14_002_19_P3]